MTIDEAIETLFNVAHEDIALEHPHYKDALKLGLEALKAWQNSRQLYGPQSFGLLPGETEE